MTMLQRAKQFQRKRGAADHLDAAESMFFQRELEYVDKTVYMAPHAPMLGRSLVPTLAGIPDWARSHTWREFDVVGASKFIANMADDLPRTDAQGNEFSKFIKPLGNSYGFSILDIKAAMAQGRSLDALGAQGSQLAVNEQIDSVMAIGDTKYKLEGLLNLTGVNTFTLSTKTAGGLTWGPIEAPNATGDEMATDVIGLAGKIFEDTKGLYGKVTIVLPIAQYNALGFRRVGNATNQTSMTALEFCLKSAFIAEIIPWHRCTGAGAGATNRMVGYCKSPLVLAGVVPMEWSPQPAQLRNLEYVINCIATTGGVIARAPVAIRYADGL